MERTIPMHQRRKNHPWQHNICLEYSKHICFGMVQVRYRYGAGTVQVRYRYGTGTVQVQVRNRYSIPGTVPGDPEGITWAFRTGFLGAQGEGGFFDNSHYLNITECLEGTNTIQIYSSFDDTSLRYFRVTKHDNICEDGTLCGLLF